MAYPSKIANPRLVNLDRDRRRLTRYQNRQISTIFPFLSLPPEIRNAVYDLCLSFKGIEVFFDTYYARLNRSFLPDTVSPPTHPIRTPTILVLNRQIYNEAIPFLAKQTVRFDHGLLNIASVREVMSEHALRHIGTLHITTKGHPVLKRHVLRESWTGYMKLFRDMVKILSKGHQLKELVIDLKDKDLATHTTRCWRGGIICDYRDHLKDVLRGLRKIRGVKRVEIYGIDVELALELKAHMESNPVTFMDLPGEVRNLIYRHCADWSDVSTQLAATMNEWVDKSSPPPYPTRTTPTILLLNKTITTEASAILAKKPLNLILPARDFGRQVEVPNLLRLIKASTLSKVQHMNLYIGCWQWMFTLGQVFPALAKTHNLQTFKLDFHDSLKETYVTSDLGFVYPDESIHPAFKLLAQIRGVKHVSITGDLPDVYADPLAEIMRSPASRTDLPVLKVIRGPGEVEDAED